MISSLAAEVVNSGAANDILQYLNLGLAGIWLLGFIKGWVVPGSMLAASEQERKKVQEDYNKVVEIVKTEVLPELENMRRVNEDLVALLRERD